MTVSPEAHDAGRAPAAGDDVVVRIDDLHKAFGEKQVLRGIDLEVRSGEVVCVIGPSGSGKSTLLRCVNLLEEPTGGGIEVLGTEVTDPDVDIDHVRTHVGMVFQQFNLFTHRTVLDNCTMAQRTVLRRSRAEAERVTRENLAHWYGGAVTALRAFTDGAPVRWRVRAAV